MSALQSLKIGVNILNTSKTAFFSFFPFVFSMVIYEGGAAVNQARSLWRMELIRLKWHGALVGWEQVFRIKHITSGRSVSPFSSSHG